MFHRGLNGWSPLLSASYGGHMDILRLLIDDYHCDPTQGDDDNVTSLHVASYKGHLAIVQYLLNTCHVEPDRADSSGNTALLYSALGGHVDLVTFFLKKWHVDLNTLSLKRRCNVSQCNREGASLSLLACKSGQRALVHKLVALGLFKRDSRDYSGRGIVHYSCMSDSDEILQYLSTHYQILISEKDRYGRTPLHMASQFASSANITRLVQFLSYEALLETDYSGQTSLHYLCCALTESHCTTDVYNKLYVPYDVPLLQQLTTFDVTAFKNYRKLFLKYVALNFNSTKQHDRVSLLSTLLKKISSCHNFNINATTATGQSLLHLACTSGSTLLVKVLEEYNINTSSLDYEGQSAVHYAALSGSCALLSYTVSQYSLNASQPDYKGVVPLAFSCMSGSINAVEYLINTAGIDVDVADDNGMTPVHYSCHHGHLDLTQYLIEVQDGDVNIRDSDRWSALDHGALN